MARPSWSSTRVRRQKRLTCASLEPLESRCLLTVTAAVQVIREATAAGPNANAQAGILATVNAFRNDLGNPNNGNAVGSQGPGRREITWDGGDNDAAPARLPSDFFNAIAPRGAIFGGDPRIAFQVSADATPAVPGTLSEFGNVNATYPTAFSAFSSPRLFTSLTHNVIDVTFVVPGTLTPATVSGFGAVFTDVDVAGSTKIEFFDSAGTKIFERNVLATAGDESLSFLGVTFVGAPLARVRITAGNSALGPNDVTQGGVSDIVVMDDFLYGEPQPLPDPRVVVGGDARSAPEVRVFDSQGQLLQTFFAYEQNFKGGIRVAAGDVNGDGTADIITAPGKGRQGEIRVFDGITFTQIQSFLAFPEFNKGLHVAAGNVNGDANVDIIVSRDKGRAPANVPQVRVFNGLNQAQLGSFFAYPIDFTGGLTVAAGDINGDFLDDIIVGAGTGNQPIRVFTAANLSTAAFLQFLPFGQNFGGGGNVAAGDFDRDGLQDIVVGAFGKGAQGQVRTFSGMDGSLLGAFLAYGGFPGGVRVAVGDADRDGLNDLIVGAGPGSPGIVQVYGSRSPIPADFFDPGFNPFAGSGFLSLLD